MTNVKVPLSKVLISVAAPVELLNGLKQTQVNSGSLGQLPDVTVTLQRLSSTELKERARRLALHTENCAQTTESLNCNLAQKQMV